jgi:hypothetical protein
MNAGDYRDPSSQTVAQLNKPRHSSSMPLCCANQSCGYYEWVRDLDLDSQKLILVAEEGFLGIRI